ncbi:MAG: DUF4256 domain-containing protein [Bacteroidetes bacterium]|nr:DUF4256 domain-containing protein [Bacteroidota bacterium]
MAKKNQKLLTPAQHETLLLVLKKRFEKHPHRHQGIAWSEVEAKLKSQPEKCWSLHEMERTDGEPDVVGYEPQTNEYIFMDCVAESPKERRSVCYDYEGLVSRKEHRPANNAIDMAEAMGITLLDEAQYRALQQLGPLDTKTSSWILTPAPMRQLGGALFADYRFGQVFVYHNGAQSYYGGRGFRGMLKV